MALAPFFDKTALSAATLLRGFDRLAFENKLMATEIGVDFDIDLTNSKFEPMVAIELLVNLLARLYPNLALICPFADTVEWLRALAKRINPSIEIQTAFNKPTVIVSMRDQDTVGKAKFNCPVIYIGSSGWVAKVNTIRPTACSDTRNPFGAAAAACLGAANVFRLVFKDQLSDAAADEDLVLSVFDYAVGEVDKEQVGLVPCDISGTTLIGAGAIGNAFAWIASRIPCLRGKMTIVDPEALDLSNLQRYVLADMECVGKSKVELVAAALEKTEVVVEGHRVKWCEFLDRDVWNLKRIAVAVDTIRERISISGALAEEVINAWTQADEVGISRHYDFGEDACLNCLYFPDREVPSEAENVVSALGLQNDTMLVRDMLQVGTPVDRAFLEKVAVAQGIPVSELLAFEGKSLRQFYSEAVCGGIMLRLGASANISTEIPMAFQSALAGIFLAAEVVISAGHLRKDKLVNSSRLRLLSAVPENLLVPVAATARCICRDTDFRSVYRRKYRPSVSL